VTILILILIQTINLCVIVWIKIRTRWISYILFLIFLGGLMVLFIYITRLASNEKFELNIKSSYQLSRWLLIILIFTTLIIFYNKNRTPENFTILKQTIILFSSPIFTITFLVITYLLLTLIIAVKITSKFEGPLRRVIKK
jgi:NADH-ubiquinone oxidoreductase chain 6